MAAKHRPWTVLPHDPLEQLSDNLWTVTGDLPGMPLRRVMTVARLEHGGLVIHNGIAMEAEAMATLEALGEPRYLVVPNGWHRLDAHAYTKRYPGLKVLCPAGSLKRVAQAVQVDGDLDQLEGGAAVAVEHLQGLKQREGVLRVRSGEGQGTTLVFNDLIFNLPHGAGLNWLVYRLMGTTGGPRVTRLMRLFMIADRRAARAHLERLADTEELQRIIVSHGAAITEDPAGVLRRVASTL